MVKGKPREQMTLKIPVEKDEVTAANGSYQRLAGIYLTKWRAAQQAAYEASREVTRLQVECQGYANRIAELTMLEDHTAEVEVKDDDGDGASASA